MSLNVKTLYPFHFNGFIQERLDLRWGDKRICEEFRIYLRDEHGFDNPSQLISIMDNEILKGISMGMV